MADERESLQTEVVALRGEKERLEAEVVRLTTAVAEALERIAELEHGHNQPPAFVKPNRPKQEGEQRPCKKRAAEPTTSRKRATPTRTERHALARCPAAGREGGLHTRGHRVTSAARG